MIPARGVPAWLFALALCLAAGAAWAQTVEPERGQERIEVPGPTPYLTPLAPYILPPGAALSPSIFRPTVPQATGGRRGPFTLTPSLTVTEEFNDNVFQDNANRKSDFITGFTPGLTLSLEGPTYSVALGYSFTAELYARNSELNDALSRQNFSLGASYRLNPRVTLGLSDVYTLDNNSNIASIEGISTGRGRSSSNTLAPNVDILLSTVYTLRLLGSWARQSFDGAGSRDSDTYRIGGRLERRLSPRLTATAGYEFAYFDIDGQRGSSTHTPRVGASYRISETLTASGSVGPSIQVTGNDVRVLPAATVDVVQRFAWGSARAAYERAVTTSGGLGGTAETDSLSGALESTTLVRGLVLGFVPRFTRARSDDDAIDVTSFTIGLQASYRLTSWLSLVGAYNFFIQRSDGSRGAADVDQNRVFLGLQFGYPIRFE